jgi:hypothetical protein
VETENIVVKQKNDTANNIKFGVNLALIRQEIGKSTRRKKSKKKRHFLPKCYSVTYVNTGKWGEVCVKFSELHTDG